METDKINTMNEQQFRDLEYLKTIITDLPENYDEIKEQIVNEIGRQVARGQPGDSIDTIVVKFISGLKDMGWRRKDVYFLVHDLLKNYRELYEDFDTILLEEESGLIGYIDASGIVKFSGEPEHVNARALYVRNYWWLR
ncbi:MAG: hypothetical protein EOP51_03985 [Sphingobacteriales bacterium]|nr:MAG: hypothetical protein EOP51_03985 [Sphingobacteriales bacterium]